MIMEDITIPEMYKNIFGWNAIYDRIKSFTIPEGTILVCCLGPGIESIEVFELGEEINLMDDKEALIKVARGSSYQFVAGTPIRVDTPAHMLSYCRLPTAKELEQYCKLPTV